MPGVRLNFNKDSVGMSFGVPGARYTVNSKGRRTVSTGIPGTGIYDVTTLSSGRSSRQSASEEVPPTIMGSNRPKPGLLASKAEKALSAFLLDIYGADGSVNDADGVVKGAAALKVEYPKLAPVLDLVTVLHGVRDEKTIDSVRELAQNLWTDREQVFSDGWVRKYLSGIYPSVSITRGIASSGAYTAHTLGFILSELYQQAEKYDEAIAVLHEMNPDQLVGISLADIEINAGDFDGAIETTEDIENEDDATAIMLVLRGVAFREKGLNEAALECFKRAIAKKARSEGVIHRGLFERAMTYKKMGKKAAAVKDLEKILVDDPSAEGVNEALAELGSEKD